MICDRYTITYCFSCKMGDTVEITTWPDHRNIFYQVSSGALSVDIKGRSHALIGLAKEPGETCEYEISIADEDGETVITRIGENVASEDTPNIITVQRFQRFWISWYDKVLRIGRHGETKPIVKTECDTGLKYITFSTKNNGYDRHPVHWRFQLAPSQICNFAPRVGSDPIKMKNVTCGSLIWVSPGDQLPDSAMIGGFEKEILYIIRAHHRGSFTPGKFVPSEGVGYIPWGGQANSKGEFEVLCGFDCAWVKTSDNKIPVGAVTGGESEVDSEPLYVGRAEHNGHLIPGKVQPSHKVCYIAYDGKEIAKKEYEILVKPGGNSHCVNSFFMVDEEEDSDTDNDYHTHDDDDDEEEEEEE